MSQRLYQEIFVDKLLSCIVFAEETPSSHAGALYKPMAKLSATIMEQKIKTELAQPKLVGIWLL